VQGNLTIVNIIVYKYLYMKELVRLFKLLSDESRLRILMLLARRELCVCQLMAVLGISQPLVSRNLSLLREGGLLEERREGKLVFYRVRKALPHYAVAYVRLLQQRLLSDESFGADLQSLADCEAFKKETGKCDMKTFLAYMRKKRIQKREKK
ncbi:MAG: ArsR/SmtB family transcription factor, partial [Chloroflexota bacterium]